MSGTNHPDTPTFRAHCALRVLLAPLALAAFYGAGSCSNPDSEFIEKWNADFRSAEAGCKSGAMKACAVACGMNESPEYCSAYGHTINVEDPKQWESYLRCGENLKTKAKPCCEKACKGGDRESCWVVDAIDGKRGQERLNHNLMVVACRRGNDAACRALGVHPALANTLEFIP